MRDDISGSRDPQVPGCRGFYAVDRDAYDRLGEQIGRPLARVYLDLMVGARRDKSGGPWHLVTPSARALAEWNGETPSTVRRHLSQLETAGVIRWEKQTNQNGGGIFLLVDLEHSRVKKNATPRPVGVMPTPTRCAKSAPPERSSGSSGAPNRELGGAIGAPNRELGGAIGAPDLHHRSREDEHTPNPVTTNPHPLPPHPTQERPEEHEPAAVEVVDEIEQVLNDAAAQICRSREGTHGLAGSGAKKKARAGVEAYRGSVGAWLAEGVTPDRCAQAVATKYRIDSGDAVGTLERRYADPRGMAPAKRENAVASTETLNTYRLGELEAQFGLTHADLVALEPDRRRAVLEAVDIWLPEGIAPPSSLTRDEALAIIDAVVVEHLAAQFAA